MIFQLLWQPEEKQNHWSALLSVMIWMHQLCIFLINDSLYLMPRIYLNGFILSYEPYVQDTIQISLTLKSKKKGKK